MKISLQIQIIFTVHKSHPITLKSHNNQNHHEVVMYFLFHRWRDEGSEKLKLSEAKIR